MKRFLVTIAFLAFASGSAHGEGAVALTWDSCTGPVDRTVAPGTVVSVYASVLGHSTPHKAYQVWLRLRPAAGSMRDAWRFDAAGCQGPSFLSIDHLVVAAFAKTCPSFQGTFQSLQIKDYSYDAKTGACQAVLADSYPAGNTAQTNPAQRYFLARFLFDMTFGVDGPTDPGVSCGGLEVPVCIQLTKSSYIVLDAADPSSVEERTWQVAQEFVTANDPTNTSNCPGIIAARPATWGAIKSQYRM